MPLTSCRYGPCAVNITGAVDMVPSINAVIEGKKKMKAIYLNCKDVPFETIESAVDSMPHSSYDRHISEMGCAKVNKNDEWKAANTVIFSVRFQKSTDADIIEWLERRGGSKAGEVKRLMRIAIGLLQNSEPEYSAVDGVGAVEEEE